MLNYLATRPKLAAFVTQALIQLYARITKLGWFDCQKDDYVFRNVIADVTRFLQVSVCFRMSSCSGLCNTLCVSQCVADVYLVCLQDSVEHCIIGVTILSQLTNEINQVGRPPLFSLHLLLSVCRVENVERGLFPPRQADTTHPLTKHRKIASSFRDSSLFDIFTLSCNLLKQVRLFLQRILFKRRKIKSDRIHKTGLFPVTSWHVAQCVVNILLTNTRKFYTEESKQTDFITRHLTSTNQSSGRVASFQLKNKNISEYNS